MSSQSYSVRRATVDDSEIVAALVSKLLIELFDELAVTHSAVKLLPVARRLLSEDDRVAGFLAFDVVGEPIGVLMLNECAAIYAFGAFGEISELYITPEHRSSGVGARLLEEAAVFGRARGWQVIEVGAPDVPRWQRTVEFYKRHGFKEIGPRLELEITER
jgi:GNAT superfamily N-acetyltransferase